MSFETIQLAQQGAVATIRLNRPAAYNALNPAMSAELLDAAITLGNDARVRAVVLTGSGNAFCAGGDVKGFAAKGDQVAEHVERLIINFHAFISHVARMPKPVIAAVNGVAAGGGLSLALACDLVVAQSDAVFSAAYSRLGASPDGSLTYSLVRRVGVHRAMDLYLTNRVLTAAQAEAWGLVARVFAPQDFARAVQALAEQLASGPTFAYGKAKELLQHSLNHTLETEMELEAQAFVACARTQDFRAAARAFAEKREPVFEGR